MNSIFRNYFYILVFIHCLLASSVISGKDTAEDHNVERFVDPVILEDKGQLEMPYLNQKLKVTPWSVGLQHRSASAYSAKQGSSVSNSSNFDKY